MCDDDRMDLLKALLPVHQREVMYRRELEEKTARWIGALFLVLAGWVLTIDSSRLERSSAHPEGAIPGSIVVVMMIGLSVILIATVYYIAKNRTRHQEVARVIVKINKCMRLWEENRYIQGETLYPEGWKEWGYKGLWGTFIRILILLALCLVAIGACYLRSELGLEWLFVVWSADVLITLFLWGIFELQGRKTDSASKNGPNIANSLPDNRRH